MNCRQTDRILLVTKTYDLILWILPKLGKFPKEQRFLLAERIENSLLDILELLIEASFSKEKLEILRKINLRLEKLRFLVRISKDMRFINVNSYEFSSRSINEIGKMIGGWIKVTKN